jgi:hypothetical protein
MTFSDICRVLRAHRCAGPKRLVAAGATRMETDPRFLLPRSGRYSISVSAGRSGKRHSGLARPSGAAPPAGAHWLRPIRSAAGPRVHRAGSRPAFMSVALESTKSMPSMLRASVGSTEASASLLARVGVVGPKRSNYFGGVRPKRARIGRSTMSQRVIRGRKLILLHGAPPSRMTPNRCLGRPDD